MGNPFEPQSGDPFGPPPSTPGYGPSSRGYSPPPSSPGYGPSSGGYGAPSGGYGPPPVTTGSYGAAGAGFGAPSSSGPGFPPSPKADYNTYAVLAPIFGVVVPPAGVALGHLALPQIRRTGERGRGAAIAGLVIGYVMCVVLIILLVWWLTSDSGSDISGPTSSSSSSSLTRITTTTTQRPSTVTSVAPPSQPPRIKLDLATVPIGTCVEITRRSTESEDALDLYGVDCERRDGVYKVTARVAASAQCHSVYAAAPPDHSLAVCLDPF